jgi:hypothetical protein
MIKIKNFDILRNEDNTSFRHNRYLAEYVDVNIERFVDKHIVFNMANFISGPIEVDDGVRRVILENKLKAGGNIYD